MNIGFILLGLLLLYDTIFCFQICFISIRDDWCGYQQSEWYIRVIRAINCQSIGRSDESEEIEARTYTIVDNYDGIV